MYFTYNLKFTPADNVDLEIILTIHSGDQRRRMDVFSSSEGFLGKHGFGIGYLAARIGIFTKIDGPP